jgi:O-antigen/teichoic acid export membrane protein
MDIGRKVLTALSWLASAKLAGQILSWAMSLVVIRLLAPADYGLMAMAVVLPSFLYLANDFGLDVVLVQRLEQSDAMRRQVFGLVILINLFFLAVLFLTAPVVAAFFNQPELTPISRLLSIQFAFFVFDTLPRARLERSLEFKGLSLITLFAALLAGLTTLVLAALGLRVWALVYGRLMNAAATTVGLNLITRSLCRPSFSMKAVWDHLSFGGLVTVDRLAWLVFQEADKVIGGKFLGEEPLGLYAVAQDLASLPMTKTAGWLTSVALPAFSQVQTRLTEVRAYLLKAVRIMSVLAFPIFLGIASVAPDVVTLLLGNKWQPVAPLMQILALVMPIRMVSTLLPAVLWAVGRPGISATNLVIAAIVMPGAFLVGVQWGVTGIALAWLLAYPAVFCTSVHRASRATGVGLGKLLFAMMSPAIASLIMYAFVVGISSYADIASDWQFRLPLLALLGAVTYVSVLLAFDRPKIQEMLALFSQ